MMSGTKDAVTGAEIDDFTRTYTGPDEWAGTAGLCQSTFTEDGADSQAGDQG